MFSFAGLRNAGAAGNAAGASADQQVLSFSANDADGTLHSTSVTLSASNAGDVNAAVTAINNALQKSGNATLKSIVAVKETNAAGTAEGIRFISSANNFSVNVGKAANNTTGNAGRSVRRHNRSNHHAGHDRQFLGKRRDRHQHGSRRQAGSVACLGRP